VKTRSPTECGGIIQNIDKLIINRAQPVLWSLNSVGKSLKCISKDLIICTRGANNGFPNKIKIWHFLLLGCMLLQASVVFIFVFILNVDFFLACNIYLKSFHEAALSDSIISQNTFPD